MATDDETTSTTHPAPEGSHRPGWSSSRPAGTRPGSARSTEAHAYVMKLLIARKDIPPESMEDVSSSCSSVHQDDHEAKVRVETRGRLLTTITRDEISTYNRGGGRGSSDGRDPMEMASREAGPEGAMQRRRAQEAARGPPRQAWPPRRRS